MAAQTWDRSPHEYPKPGRRPKRKAKLVRTQSKPKKGYDFSVFSKTNRPASAKTPKLSGVKTSTPAAPKEPSEAYTPAYLARRKKK
jgi:hypothetical protein